MLGNGSDECIDILLHCFCTPGKDNIIICPPAYPSYETYATVNDVEVRKAPLLDNFQLGLIHLENLVDENTRIMWLTSPNDSTGNSLNRADIELVLNNFSGLVVIDEAYINFAKQRSFLQELAEYPNLVILQTFGKAWGLAGLRLAMAFASEEIIEVLHRVKPPYNISQPVIDLALKALEEVGQVNDMIRELVAMRNALAEVLKQIPIVEKVYPSDANFLLVKVKDVSKVYEFLLSKGIAVKDMNSIPFCEGCLRITVGTEQENTLLVDALASYPE
jgi:histidinol-phosphate aminotransferase